MKTIQEIRAQLNRIELLHNEAERAQALRCVVRFFREEEPSPEDAHTFRLPDDGAVVDQLAALVITEARADLSHRRLSAAGPLFIQLCSLSPDELGLLEEAFAQIERRRRRSVADLEKHYGIEPMAEDGGE